MPDPEPNRAPVPARPPWWFRLVRALLNLALLFLLGLQGFALVLLWTDGHLSLPGFARHALEDRLQDQGLSVRFRSLEVSLSGRLRLSEPQIYLAGSQDPIAEADFLEIDPDWLSLWWKRQFSLSELRLYNANLFCPPESSPSGIREAFIQHLDFALTSQGHRWWLLSFLRAQLLNVDMQARGTFLWPSIEAPTSIGSAISSPAMGMGQTLATAFRKWAGAVVKLQPQFACVSKPVMWISLTGEEPGLTKLDAIVIAAGAKPPVAGLVLGRVRAQGTFIWDGHSLRSTAPIVGNTQSIRYESAPTGAEAVKGLFSSGQVWVSVQLADGPTGLLIHSAKRIQISAVDATLGNFPVEVLAADFDLQQGNPLAFTAYAAQGTDSLKLSGHLKLDWSGSVPDLEDGQLDFHAQSSLTTILTAGHWTLPPALASLAFDDKLKADGRLVLAPGHRLDSVDWILHTKGAHFQRFNLEQASAQGRLDFDSMGNCRLNASQISLINQSWRADGSYFENFGNHDFRLLAHGNLDPQVLDPYLGDWWQPLWQFIVPQGKWPEADAEFSGNWDGPWWANDLFVYAQVAGARAKRVPMDSIRVRVLQRPEYLAVYDIAAHATGGGDLSGAMIWAIKPAISHIVEQRNFFDSTLPLPDVAALAGPEVANIVQPLDSPVSPKVQVDQRSGTDFDAQPDIVATKIHAEFSEPFRIYKVPLDGAIIDALNIGKNTDIPQLAFGIADGMARASGSITSPDGTPQLSFTLRLQNARQADFLSALGQFDTTGNTASTGLRPTPTNPAPVKTDSSVLGSLAHPGLLDLSLSGRFIFGQPDSLLSLGHVRIHDAQLGQLQLFGRLSKLMAETKVPLGDFDLHSAQSDLQIAQQYLRLPNLVVTGPTARIQAAGIYHFSDGELNFNTLIFPIGESDTFLIKQLANIANPFVNTVTLQLHGNLEKPAWEISMNPLRLFENRTIAGPPIPGMQADADGAPVLPILPVPPPLPDLPAGHR